MKPPSETKVLAHVNLAFISFTSSNNEPIKLTHMPLMRLLPPWLNLKYRRELASASADFLKTNYSWSLYCLVVKEYSSQGAKGMLVLSFSRVQKHSIVISLTLEHFAKRSTDYFVTPGNYCRPDRFTDSHTGFILLLLFCMCFISVWCKVFKDSF